MDKSFVPFLQRFTRFDEIPEGNRQFCIRKAVNNEHKTQSAVRGTCDAGGEATGKSQPLRRQQSLD
jgi:hypothetical protein